VAKDFHIVCHRKKSAQTFTHDPVVIGDHQFDGHPLSLPNAMKPGSPADLPQWEDPNHLSANGL
jgi:hypothetical protein